MFTLATYAQLLLNKFGGLFTEADPRSLPPGASPQCWDVDYLIAGVGTRPGTSNPVISFTPALTTFPVEYIKSARLLGPVNLTLVEDAGTTLYKENLNSPGIFTSFYSGILNHARAISITVHEREYIGLSDLIQGTDQPRQYDGTNLDRISQVGPGAGPAVEMTAPEYPITSITEIYPAKNVNSMSWGSAINLYNAQQPSTNLYFLGAPGQTDFTTNLKIGDIVYTSNNMDLSFGANPNGTYTITSIGNFSDVDGIYQYFGVTASIATAGFARGTAGGTFQRTPALIQLSMPIPLQDAVIGASITIQGASIPQWNRTWVIAQTPTIGQLSITSTSLTTNVATYDYTLQSGVAPGWQPIFDYPMAAQIVSPAGDVWQITTPGISGPTIPSFASSPQTDGTAVWTKQPGAVKVLATVFNTNNGNGIFNIQNQIITSATETSFTVAITSPNISSAAEAGSAVTGSGTALIIDPGTRTLGTGNPGTNPIYGNATGGDVLVANPLIAPGQRWAVLMFLTRNGFITPASPPTIFFTTVETGTLTFKNLPIGPPDVIARIVAITLANASPGGPYFWIPEQVITPGSAQSLGISQQFYKTVLDDNTSTSLGPVTFSDAILSEGINISVAGNNLQQERELAECVKPIQWAGRCFYLGERTKVDQFVNLTFDGGSISGNPAGWTITSGMASHVSVVNSPIFGQSLQITGASGNLIIDLSSVSAGNHWPISIPLSSMTASLTEFILPLNNPLWQNVPSDLLLRVYPSNIGPTDYLAQSAFQTAGLLSPIIQPNTAYSIRVTCSDAAGTLLIDRMEVFPTLEPVYTRQVAVSYLENQEAIDGVTGAIDTSSLSSDSETNHFIFLNKYFITTKSKTFSPIQSASGEPSSWQIDEISNDVGSLGPLAEDVGEEYTIVADDRGVYVFDGGNHMKISQEIQQLWDLIYKPAKKTVWVLNDLRQQRILVGVPLPTPNQWLPNAAQNLTPATPNVILVCSYLGLMTGAEIANGHAVFPSAFTGQLLFHDMHRKWTIWQIPAATAAWVARPDGSEQIWFGQSS